MQISVALRGGTNTTDHRVLAVAEGISYLPHTVRLITRGAALDERVDLLIQTGFGNTIPLLDAIERRIPYIIMEEPIFRGFYDGNTTSSFTYNGIQNGGTRPKVPPEPRRHPKLMPMHNGATLVLGQKPNDRSLRGSDHIAWIKDKLSEYQAELRHNPIMVPQGYNLPIADALIDIGRTVAYTSTASVDSVFAGCETICEHQANEAYGITDRQEWAHRLSWYQFTHTELQTDDIAAFILTGYDEAAANAKEGKVEIPLRITLADKQAEMTRYYEEHPYA